jgi:hypothetical protein
VFSILERAIVILPLNRVCSLAHVIRKTARPERPITRSSRSGKPDHWEEAMRLYPPWAVMLLQRFTLALPEGAAPCVPELLVTLLARQPVPLRMTRISQSPNAAQH